MAETFTLQKLSEGMEWSQGMSPDVMVAEHPYLDHIASMAIFNVTGSGKVVKIKEICINPVSSITISSTVLGGAIVQRITALTGGETLVPTKLDSNNAALPSQVSVVKYPAATTLTGSPLFRVALFPTLNMTRVLSMMASASGSHHRLGPGQLLSFSDATTVQMQKITLREGEGIVLGMNGGNNALPIEYDAALWIRNQSSGACYQVRERVFTSELGLLAVHNGAGSGVILEVFNIELYEAGTDDMASFTVEGIDGAEGDAATTVAHDSTNTLPSSVRCIRNAHVKSAGFNEGVKIAIPQRRRVAMITTQHNAVATPPLSIWKNQLWNAKEGYEMVLREGKGIGIFKRTTGGVGRFDISITFTVDGALGSAVFPGVGDVDLGITYGPNGTDSTGTLLQPAEADVELGVSYGAGGTEFTGELVGGGGGTFISIVNE